MRPLWVICVVLALLSGAAFADDKPWAEGISPDDQKAALALYNDGNKEFFEGMSSGDPAHYKEALQIYARAIAVWDHPAIRYNMAVCLINLDRVVEAYENLERAMKFGAAPLDAKDWRDAQTSLKLLAGRIAQIQVNAEPGAIVSLDGKPLTDSHQRVVSGDHQIVVEKPRYLTETRAVRADPGKTVVINITLRPITSVKELHRRWARWVPWTVMGAGVVAAAVGAPFLVASSNTYGDYEKAVLDCRMGCVTGTPSGQPLNDLMNQAKRDNNIAVSLFIGGGVIAATGFVMVILNQPHLVTPEVGRDHVGLAIAGHF